MTTYEQPSQAGIVLTHVTALSATLGTGGGTATDFYIKVLLGRFRTGSRLTNITGDGDTQETYLSNLLNDSTFDIWGQMVAAQAIGLSNIVDSTKNPIAAVVFNLGGARAVTGTWFIEWIYYEFNKNNAFVPIRMTGKTSGAAMTEIPDEAS